MNADGDKLIVGKEIAPGIHIIKPYVNIDKQAQAKFRKRLIESAPDKRTRWLLMRALS